MIIFIRWLYKVIKNNRMALDQKSMYSIWGGSFIHWSDQCIPSIPFLEDLIYLTKGQIISKTNENKSIWSFIVHTI